MRREELRSFSWFGYNEQEDAEGGGPSASEDDLAELAKRNSTDDDVLELVPSTTR
jgi:hypothetical protein